MSQKKNDLLKALKEELFLQKKKDYRKNSILI